MKILLKILFVSVILFACTSVPKANKRMTFEEKLAVFKDTASLYYDDFLYMVSPDSNHVLCYSEEKRMLTNPYPNTNYFVFDLSDMLIVLKNKISLASLDWFDNSNLKVTLQYDKDSKRESKGNIYLIDIKDGNLKILKR